MRAQLIFKYLPGFFDSMIGHLTALNQQIMLLNGTTGTLKIKNWMP
jgi:hypothetical protein